MNCKDYKILLADYNDKVLDPSLHNEVKSHIAACPSCSEDLLFLKNYKKTIRTLRPRKAPKNFFGQVQERLEHPGRFEKILHTLFHPLNLKLPLEAAGLLAAGFLIIFLLKPQLEVERKIISFDEAAHIDREKISSPKARVAKKTIASAGDRSPSAGLLGARSESDLAKGMKEKSVLEVKTYRIALVFASRNRPDKTDNMIEDNMMSGVSEKEEEAAEIKDDRKNEYRLAQKSKKAGQKPAAAIQRRAVPAGMPVDSIRKIASSLGCRIVREIVNSKTNRPRSIIVEVPPGSYSEFIKRISRVGEVRKRGTSLPAKIERKSSIHIDLVE